MSKKLWGAESSEGLAAFEGEFDSSFGDIEDEGWTIESVSFLHTYDAATDTLIRTAYIIYSTPEDEE